MRHDKTWMARNGRLPFRASAIAVLWLSAVGISGCIHNQVAPPASSYGSNPTLPAPKSKLLPEIEIARAIGWSEGEKPIAAAGLEVNEFAGDLNHPRWLYVLPNGDVLVAETNAPARPDDAKGIRGWAMRRAQKKAGAAAPSANRIILLRDANRDGIAELRTDFIKNLNSPFGMALVGDRFYVANTDAVLKFRYAPGDTNVSSTYEKVADLPAGSINHHWTKNIIANADGTHLYATVGSNSNVAENGMYNEEQRAAILEIDLKTGASRVYAAGLRNPNGLAWQPATHQLWTVVNERDELGDDLVPDYLTSVQDGKFYGWPYSYYGRHVDTRAQPPQPDLVAKAVAPDYALGAHTASLGLTFYDGKLLPKKYLHGAFIGQHGSWNRSSPSGYKVIFVSFVDGKPTGLPQDVLTGFLDEDGKARGRPVGVVVDGQGALLVADDVGNKIWRVSAK